MCYFLSCICLCVFNILFVNYVLFIVHLFIVRLFSVHLFMSLCFILFIIDLSLSVYLYPFVLSFRMHSPFGLLFMSLLSFAHYRSFIVRLFIPLCSFVHYTPIDRLCMPDCFPSCSHPLSICFYLFVSAA